MASSLTPRQSTGAEVERPPSSVMGASPLRDDRIGLIMRDPLFQNLVQSRSRFAWTLSAVMLLVYLGFIVLVAFAPDLMGTKIGGGTTSLGIVIGLAVIVFAFVLTGLYVARANGRYDELTSDLKTEIER